jgi:hypothetical protein
VNFSWFRRDAFSRLMNIEFHATDLSASGSVPADWLGTFDLITSFDVIHDLSQPAGSNNFIIFLICHLHVTPLWLYFFKTP